MSKTLLSVAGPGAAAAALLTLPATSTAEDERTAWQEARIVGEAESCIPLRSIRRTQVHDDSTIDFHMNGRRIYRNTLPMPCGSLGFEESFSYETTISSLCSNDVITVLRHPIGRGLQGPRCGLGEFVPIEYPED